MGKPSIFSKEYEKKMRKRRRNVILICLTIVLILSALTIKVIYNPIDYKNIKKNIQAWIDSDANKVSETIEKTEKQEEVTEDNVVKEEPKKPSEEFISITLVSGNTAKAIYVDDNSNGTVFKSLDTTDKDVRFNISPSGKQMIVIDTNSVITLYNVDKTSKIVSKDQYVSSNGGVFTKDDTMQKTPQYLWNTNPKFISEDKIIFVSNRPYFGKSNLKQYLWMTDVLTGTDKVFFELAGANIDIGEKEEKGVKVTIDNKIYYVDVNGNYVQ